MGKRKSIMLLLTYNCNLRCSYCYEPKLASHRMSASKAKEYILHQIDLLDEDYDSVEIQFMGGEPLLEFHLMRELSEWLWSLDLPQKLLVLFAPTNGTLLNEEMKEWFRANKDRIQLGLSFDGDFEMQDINRSGSSLQVDLSFFAGTWPDQSVKMTISPSTIAKLSKGVKFLHENGIRFIDADLAMGKELVWDRDSLEMLRDELSRLADYYLEKDELIPMSMLRLDVCTILSAQKNASGKTCSCGEDLVCIDWTGAEYACHLFSPVALPIAEATRSRGIDFSKHENFLSEECRCCVLRGACNRCCGMNYICTGEVNKVSAFHCNAFKIIFAANCKHELRRSLKKGDYDRIEDINRIMALIKI